MFRVALLDDYQNVALGLADWSSLLPRAEVVAFADHIDHDENLDALVARLEPFHCVMLMRERTHFPRKLIERLPNLRLIVSAAMWNIAIDLDAAAEHGVQVCGTNDLSNATPELTFGLLLSLARQIHVEERAVREGRWQTTLGIAVRGKTLGIVGLGNIGSQVAALGQAFGMHTIAWSQNLDAARATAAGAELVSKEDLFARADFVTIHVKLSERTRGLVTARELALMQAGAYLINTSRGPVVDEAALLEALTERRIAGAALDVFDHEPLALDHPFRRLDNVLVSPHVGYVTRENYAVFYGDALEDIRAFLDGRVIRAMNRAL